MAFFGYNNKEAAQKVWGNWLDKTKQTRRNIIVCNTHSRCVGSSDGKIFRYEDGSEDTGRKAVEVSAVLQKTIDVNVKWLSSNGKKLNESKDSKVIDYLIRWTEEWKS